MSAEESSWRPLFLALRLAWSLGYIIAIPAVLFGFGGAYLDKTLETSPGFLLAGFIIAITLSYLGVRRKIKEITAAEKD
ncbi:hypothetical protein A3D88_01135 [Candidatus Peribacteria bacterium RIFCSPHIGHO2_02_FULL_52_16]|nr:MAG: hypothetical protein A2706_05780 [Candidatus Peribacteria bacterium RIFCSPHIGHO2_01_FULL_51_35]OGJ61268.1 MAG: hypothetical protein A3D88_01135 [Candidatus Peribacteria bacterium RIFCSPHIGHO2_02_FULL_52_16]